MQAVFLAEAHAVTPEFTSQAVDPACQGTGASLWSSVLKVGWRPGQIASCRLYMADSAEPTWSRIVSRVGEGG